MFTANGKQLELDFSSTTVLPREALEVLPRTSWKADKELQQKRLEGLLSVFLDQGVQVRLNDNRSTMVSFSKRSGSFTVRLHRMFRHAQAEDVRALAGYILGEGVEASRQLDAFIAGHRSEIRESGGNPTLNAQGQHHDLEAVLARVGGRYFGGVDGVGIGWGKGTTGRRRRRSRTRSRALATYSYDDKAIRVSPVLDSPKVPEFVLDWIVYHELLHHVLPVECGDDGRRKFHTKSFRVLERAFEHYDRARIWERENLDWLLR